MLVVELSQHLVAIALVRCESVNLDGIVQTNKNLGIIAALYGIGRELKNLKKLRQGVSGTKRLTVQVASA